MCGGSYWALREDARARARGSSRPPRGAPDLRPGSACSDRVRPAMDRARGRRTLLCAVGSVAVTLVAGGCALKGGQNISLIQGKVLYIKDCAQCHALARAHTTGVIGPNLDYAFSESLA